ncbi:MAG TPA: pseudouridine-5'-phosphate glycosidase [Candidatus Limnocylindrales bacterium]|nr:pseudouridine-5'-phosphate glycosidase [Candidatus Limnocylindrales bacterium]
MSSSVGGVLEVAAGIEAALAAGRPVVALESTLITHGLAWPRNLEAARRSEDAVAEGGSLPATVAVHGGRLMVGLTPAQLEAVAQDRSPLKASRATLAVALAGGGWAGTTVSATMIAARQAGISVFATGGIGGVHRGGERTFDISADLDELARTPLVVTCSGPKSILDVGLTLEYLETRGVPVVGWQTDELAGFFSRSSGHRLVGSVADADEVARLARAQWALGLEAAIVVAVPVPADAALAREEADDAIARAVGEADANGIHGPASTPWVLARVAELTEGRSVAANLALIENNARVAGLIAARLTARPANR